MLFQARTKKAFVNVYIYEGHGKRAKKHSLIYLVRFAKIFANDRTFAKGKSRFIASLFCGPACRNLWSSFRALRLPSLLLSHRSSKLHKPHQSFLVFSLPACRISSLWPWLQQCLRLALLDGQPLLLGDGPHHLNQDMKAPQRPATSAR